MSTYYDLLGLSPKASETEIRSAYARDTLGLQKAVTPDAARFRAVLDEAFATLIDAERRSAYDAQLRNAKKAKKAKPPKPPRVAKVAVPEAAKVAADPSHQASSYARNGGLVFALGGMISAFTYVFSNRTYLLAWAPLLVGGLALAWWLVRYLRMPKSAWRPDHILLLGGLILFGLVSAGWVGLTGTTP